jgi:hypothetical protein
VLYLVREGETGGTATEGGIGQSAGSTHYTIVVYINSGRLHTASVTNSMEKDTVDVVFYRDTRTVNTVGMNILISDSCTTVQMVYNSKANKR